MPETVIVAFPRLMRERRQALELSQEDVARRSGLGLRTILSIENGATRPRIDTAEKIAAALELPLASLLAEAS